MDNIELLYTKNSITRIILFTETSDSKISETLICNTCVHPCLLSGRCNLILLLSHGINSTCNKNKSFLKCKRHQ